METTYMKSADHEQEEIALIVDDCEVNRTILRTMLHILDNSIMVMEACNGRKGLDMFKVMVDQGYNLRYIFMDYHMPIMDGDESITAMCQYLKEKTGKTVREYGKVKAVMVTANTDYRVKDACEGCTKCSRTVMYKPVSKEAISKILAYE